MSIGTKTADYNNYFMALKGNYRKGTNRFRTILANPATAEEYSENLGGCCVVLGWPIGEDDRNSQDLLAMLKESTVISQSVLTWLGQWYSEYNQDADMMYSDAVRCAELEADPLMARAVSMDRIALGKLIVTLSGGDCADYADINAVVSSTEVMTAVAAAPAAMQALIVNADAITAAAASETAYQAIFANAEALGAVVASKPAMEAMIASPTALNAMVTSETVMAAIIGSSTALNAVVSSQTAMTAVAKSTTAMRAVAGSATAIRAVVASSTAKTAMIAQNAILQSVAGTWWNTVQSGFTVVRTQQDKDGVADANSANSKYIMFAIPGGYNNGSGTTNCFHGHNGAAAGSASGSYSDTAKRKILLGGGTFTENGDGMVRTWIYSI